MQEKPRHQEQHGQQQRTRQHEKNESELTFKKIIEFFKGVKP